MIDKLPAALGQHNRHVFIVLQGVGAAATVRATRFGDAIASVFPSEEERADFGQPNEAEDEWTEAKNQRRCDLIDRKYLRGLTSAEAKELASLQALMVHHRQRIAPLPIEDAQRLYRELLARVGTPGPTTNQ